MSAFVLLSVSLHVRESVYMSLYSCVHVHGAVHVSMKVSVLVCPCVSVPRHEPVSL